MSQKSIDSAIRDGLGKDISDVLRNFTDKVMLGKDVKFYTGMVVNNDDPNKEGRCRIRVYGIYGDEIPDDDIPWSVPDFNFIGSTLGSFIVPPLNAIVKVFFDNEDFYTPRYTTKVMNRTALSKFTAGYDEDYPNSMIFFETDQGDYFKVNRATNESIYRHASGFIIKVDKDGNILIDDEGVNTGDLQINVKGNLDIKVGGNCAIEATGSLDLIGTNTTLKGNLDVTLNAPGGSAWVPNVLPADPFSGVPHGGLPGGLPTIKSAG